MRARNLFRIAVEQGNLRWGRRTAYAAGAALIFAVREDASVDVTKDLAVSPNVCTTFCVFKPYAPHS